MKTRSEIVRENEKKYVSCAQKIPYYDMVFEKGKGSLIYDMEGNEYIDLLSSAGSANIGHGNEEVAKAVENQMMSLCQFTVAYAYMENSVKLAEKLVSLAPGDFEKKIAYGLSGSDCIDGAIKFAKGYTGRNKLISFRGSYHGNTYGALSLSALSLNMRKKIDRLNDVYHFSYPICKNCIYEKTADTCSLQCLKEIEEAFKNYLPAEEVAAVFFEAIAGDAGIIVPPQKYVDALYKLCKDNGILFVVDEIQQGMGRTGKWFAIEHFNIAPDMMVLGKAVGGGLPMGVVIGRKEIIDCLGSPAHLFTLGGNATVAAAALKTIEIIQRDHIIEHAAEMGAYFTEKMNLLKEKYEIVGDVRGLGLSLALEFVKDKETMEPSSEAAIKVCYNCVQEGIYLIFLGKSSLRIQPPLVITKEQIDKVIYVFESSIIKYLNGEISDEAVASIKGW